jgi:hypothetical protein
LRLKSLHLQRGRDLLSQMAANGTTAGFTTDAFGQQGD